MLKKYVFLIFKEFVSVIWPTPFKKGIQVITENSDYPIIIDYLDQRIYINAQEIIHHSINTDHKVMASSVKKNSRTCFEFILKHIPEYSDKKGPIIEISWEEISK